VTVTVGQLLGDYRAGRLRPSDVAQDIGAAAAATQQPVWISLVSQHDLDARARELDDADPALALYGVPFAVKDNIDVAGMTTTAACPSYARVAREHAPVVRALLDAGAMLVGKTNLDQFATGLVGTRSPYGSLSSFFDQARVSGGSSSGSAVAVASGLVAFALGTDTAGSGRVPAAFNGLIGVKPTRGLLSARGVVPACASLDCISIFAHNVADAALVLEVAAAFDPDDVFSRPPAPSTRPRRGVVGLPIAGQADPDEEAAVSAWGAVGARASEMWTVATVDVSPLLAAAPLLYDVWVAERAAALGGFVATGPAGLDPTVASIIAAGETVSGVRVFEAMHRIAALQRAAQGIWEQVDAVVLPTAPLHPTHAQVASDLVGVNDSLGRFTNFANLLDLAAVALPGGQRPDGLPFGITLFGPAGDDRRLLELAAQWLGERTSSLPAGPEVELAVAGAHMRGLALNSQLTARGATFVRRTNTGPHYRLYALDGHDPPRPGLVRVREDGTRIEVEIWRLAPSALGALLAEIPEPLGLGRVELDDSTSVAGFLCEGYVADDACDISHHGSWRAYLASPRVAAVGSGAGPRGGG
jgi:allophanate hydrolase